MSEFKKYLAVNLSRYAVLDGELFEVARGYVAAIEGPCLVVVGSGYVRLDGLLKVG